MEALIVVDLQNDFMPGGALGVPHGNETVPLANRLMRRFDLVVATQDWHPPGHVSFASSHPGKRIGDVVRVGKTGQYLWPDHCVQDTPGADLASMVDRSRIDRIIRKGRDPDMDSYSTFFDNDHRSSTGLEFFLMAKNANPLYICGLATDYCVKFSCLDAVRLGFDIAVIEDACRGIDKPAGNVKRALEEMRQAGVKIISSPELL